MGHFGEISHSTSYTEYILLKYVNTASTTGYILYLVNAYYSVCRLPSACESAHVLSGIRARLRALSTVLWGGVAGSGGSGSACTYVLPVAQPQLPAGHPGWLLPGWRYSLCRLRLITTHHYRPQLLLQHKWVPVKRRWDRAVEDSLWFLFLYICRKADIIWH